MKKVILSFALFLGTTFWLMAQQTFFTLTGTTNNIPDNTMLFLMDAATSERVDSIAIIDNQFFFRGNAHPFKEYFLLTQYDGKHEYRSIFVENTNMFFDASHSNFFKAKVSGSVLQAQSDELFNLVVDYAEKAMVIGKKMRKLTDADKVEITKLQKERKICFQKTKEITIQFVKDHPDYLTSVKQLTFLKNQLPKAETAVLYNALTKELKNTTEGKAIKIWLDQSVKLAIGDKAPDFQLPNLQGTSIALSNFKGKYVLLEFGASGCGPCRMENPNLLKAYQNYQDKGFEILSVWLDKSKNHWESTVAKDQMIWTTVSDLQGNHGVVPLTYNVIDIPDNYLLNPAGEVIAKDLRGAALEEKLTELFNGQ